MMICACGREMNRNGVRSQKITDYDDGKFFTNFAEVKRFRCSTCGTSDNWYVPEIEEGFRLSRNAADTIIDRSISGGMRRAGEEAGVDSASVSRLVTSRANRLLNTVERPRIARLDQLENNSIAIADAMTGETIACFYNLEDTRLHGWLMTPYPSVIMPSAAIVAKTVRWVDFKVALAVDTALEMLRPLIAKAEQRFEHKRSHFERRGISQAVADSHFIRIREKLYYAFEAADITSAKQQISAWIENCKELWSDVFTPVISYLQTYQECLFSHVACLHRPQTLRLDFKGPANLMTLAYNHVSRHLSSQSLVPEGLKFTRF
jgi:hypothetical protein